MYSLLKESQQKTKQPKCHSDSDDDDSQGVEFMHSPQVIQVIQVIVAMY